MSTNLTISTQNGYVFHNGKLRAYEFISADIDFASGIVEYTCNLGGERTTLSSGLLQVYANEIDYNKGVAFKERDITLREVLQSAFGLNYGMARTCISNECMYKVVNNEVVSVKLPTEFLYNGNEHTWVGGERLFATSKDAALYCDLIKVEQDGTEVVYPSAHKRVALKDDQKKIVDQISELIKKANEMGIQFIFDYENEYLKAYDRTDIKNIEYYDYDCDDMGSDIAGLLTDVGVSLIGANCSDMAMYAEFKS